MRTTSGGLRDINFSFALAAIFLVLNAIPAEGAFSSMVSTSGSIATGQSQSHTLPSNIKDGSAEPVSIHEAGDDAVASAKLMATEGSLELSSHGCSGPALGAPGGSANANSSVNYGENFVIQSDTLAVGTPVTINVKVAAARAYRANVIQPMPIRLGAAAASGEALVVFSTTTDAVFRGSFGISQVEFQPIQRGMAGIFVTSNGPPEDAGEANGDEFTGILPGKVGDSFIVSVRATVGATSSALNPVTGDGDGQMSLNWGASVEGGLAVIGSPTGDLFPPPTGATLEVVLRDLPPRPVAMPEPTSGVLLLVGAGLFVVGRVRP